MISVNLIPSERKFARARRTRIRRWLWAGGVYALALAGAIVQAQTAEITALRSMLAMRGA